MRIKHPRMFALVAAIALGSMLVGVNAPLLMSDFELISYAASATLLISSVALLWMSFRWVEVPDYE